MSFGKITPEIVIAAKDLSPAAFRLFCYYLSLRNNSTSEAKTTNTEAAQALGMPDRTLFRSKSELVKVGWVCSVKDGVKVLYGFEQIETAKNGSANFDTAKNGSKDCQKWQSDMPKMAVKTAKNGSAPTPPNKDIQSFTENTEKTITASIAEASIAVVDSASLEPTFAKQSHPVKPHASKPKSEDITPPAFLDPLESHHIAIVGLLDGRQTASQRVAIKKLWNKLGRRIIRVDECVACYDFLRSARYSGGGYKFAVVDWHLVVKLFDAWREGRISDDCKGQSSSVTPIKRTLTPYEMKVKAAL